MPCAWWRLETLAAIYKPCAVSIPDAIELGVWIFEEIMGEAGVTYGQPQTNMAALQGTCSKSTLDWYEEGLYQHGVATYLNLLGGTSITKERLVPARPRRNRRRPGAPSVTFIRGRSAR